MRRDGPLRGQHPKISATVEKVFHLWENAEKVLVFCHWRATGKALRLHLSRRIQQWVREEAFYALGCDRMEEVDAKLDAVRKRFDPERPIGRHLDTTVNGMLDAHRMADAAAAKAILDVVRRFVREDSFLVRYFDLERPESIEGFDLALDKRDASGLTLREKLAEFVRWIAVSRTEEERTAHLAALSTISTKTEGDGSAGDSDTWVPNVRLATGAVDASVRKNLLLTFNTPFFPEILIASSVMAEGVDLHVACRQVIHHDLSWNPSTLEQRTGRVDRIGCKAERVDKSIEIFLPYVAATQDEKMFRVVRDRERWFTVLLGEGDTGPPQGNSKERVPLPAEAVAGLTFRLGVGVGGGE